MTINTLLKNMLLESIRRIIDPQARNLDISHIVGKKVSWEIVNNNLECTILAPWFLKCTDQMEF